MGLFTVKSYNKKHRTSWKIPKEGEKKKDLIFYYSLLKSSCGIISEYPDFGGSQYHLKVTQLERSTQVEYVQFVNLNILASVISWADWPKTLRLTDIIYLLLQSKKGMASMLTLDEIKTL